MRLKNRTPRRILVIDVGGTHIKFRVSGQAAAEKLDSGKRMTPAAMVARIRKQLKPDAYDAVAIGYPGLVFRGRITAEPYNLGAGRIGYDFHKGLHKPVRIINDAAMQALGSYEGGRMLFLGLGTGLGATLILEGIVEPMEIGHLPYKNGRTYEEYVGERGRERLGNHKWRKHVMDVIEQLKHTLEVDYAVIGGGNAVRLKKLPKDVRLGNNENAFAGGIALWKECDEKLLMLASKQSDAGKRVRSATPA